MRIKLANEVKETFAREVKTRTAKVKEHSLENITVDEIGFIWNIALFAPDTWTLRNVKSKYLEGIDI